MSLLSPNLTFTLKSLLESIPAEEGLHPFQSRVTSFFENERVTGIAYDSRKIEKGNIFVCIAGEHVDGHDFIAQAVKAKASAVVVENIKAAPQGLLDSFPIICAPRTYRALALLATRFYGNPSKQLFMVGVTGTNGKTTVSHLVQEIMAHSERFNRAGLLGTLGYKGPDVEDYQKTAHTTPMALELQQILRAFVTDHYDSVVMEVSSHALEQDRVEGCDFDVAVMTNLTQDHLDYHKTMSHYFQAKAKLFASLETPEDASRPKPKKAVINLDDEYARQFISYCPTNVEVLTYGLEKDNVTEDSEQPQVRATDVHYAVHGASYRCITPVGEVNLKLKIAGQFGVYNSLAAVATGLAMDIPLETIRQALETVPGIRGRFEVVSESPAVVVDYAHTPDGLENVLSAARTILPNAEARLIVVFGCGGDRDASKRPKMGAIAEKLSDYIIVTSDNPRSEDPQQIISDILTGIQSYNPRKVLVEPDRRLAIQRAIDEAKGQDIVVVAGKGHEDYQILNNETIHFDDKEEVVNYLAQKTSST